MSAATKPTTLSNWIPPGFGWSTAVDVLAVKVPVGDPDVVEFVGSGSCSVQLHRTRGVAMMSARLNSAGSLRGKLDTAAWIVLRHTEDWKKRLANTRVHCHGAFRMPGDTSLLLLVGGNPPSRLGAWLPDTVCTAARELVTNYLANLAEFEARIDRKKQEDDEFFGSAKGMEKFKKVGDVYLAIADPRIPPVLTAERLLPHLPSAATFAAPRSLNPRSVERAAIAAILESGWATSRDGTYVGILSVPLGRERNGLVTWSPYAGPPAYPEVRWTVQRRLPSALLKPRLNRPARPNGVSAGETIVVRDTDAGETDSADALDDLQLDDSDFRRRVDEVRGDLKARSFEAIAWFQSYHTWTEDTWGIYFDARKLDALALSILDELRAQNIPGSPSDAARLALGLTYAHELFHARVEAALSWLEVNVQRPRYLRYKRRVYDALRETPDWLEEALANWAAWDWFQSEPVRAMFARSMSSLDRLQRVVESTLDLSPPGYRDWRVGHRTATWRTFATQLSTGSSKPTAAAIGLPLESTLRGPLPYELQSADIPVRFVGSGVIADRLHSNPATFNVPARRELVKALKYFKHDVDPSGGKGSHQKWTGPDHGVFILPTRDPLSVGVFRTFLKHVGIDKATYVRNVRPSL